MGWVHGEDGDVLGGILGYASRQGILGVLLKMSLSLSFPSF